MPLADFPRRMIHLDFHTGPDIPDVGSEFDAEEFAQTFVAARVDSVTVFAKCHHGHLYYDTARPERHPGLPKGLDLLGTQVEALRRRDIRAPIYVSIQVDEYAARTHPEWLALDREGRPVKRGGLLEAGWYTLDMSSPYQEYVVEQIAEVLARFAPVDGLFLDMCWDQPSLSRFAVDGMRRRGYDPREEADCGRYAREVAHGYMARFKKMLDEAQAGRAPSYIWYNSRPKVNLPFERQYLEHVEVECLPTGGWGYAYFPYVARFVRPFGLPTLSHTGRFHTSWGDFGGLKPEAALRYECCLILSQGMTSGVGDQLHPRGRPDRAVYERIGKVYRYIEACEPWTEGGEILSDAAVIVDPEQGDRPGAAGLGLTRALQQLRCQFDLLPPAADLSGFSLVIVPETVRPDAALRGKLRGYLAAGGALIACGAAALDEDGKPIFPELGIEAHGESPFTTTFLRPGEATRLGLPEMDVAMYERGLRITPAAGAEALCGVVEPYFERSYEHFCSHAQTPPDKESPYAAVVQRGRVITFAHPICTAYGRHGCAPHRHLLGSCINRLLPQPLLCAGGPVHLETTVLRKGETTVVHLISYCPMRQTEQLDLVEDPFPLVDVPLSVRLPRAPRRALLAPSGREIPIEWRDGRAEVRVTHPEGHTMVVFE